MIVGFCRCPFPKVPFFKLFLTILLVVLTLIVCLQLVVGIMSAPSHTEARMAIRQTWGHFGQRRDVSLAFMLGMSRVNTINTATFQESQIYGDVVRADFLDSYDNLTLKTVSLLDWVENYCSKVINIYFRVASTLV